jgi:hypothetical protein
LRSHIDRRPILLPANICPIVPITFMKAGVDFVFVDIDVSGSNMDLDAAFQRLKAGRFGGVLYVHTYGEPSTPDDFFIEAKRLDDSFLIVDDRCLCIPDLSPSDSDADAILYSTGYAKMADLGFGGYAFLQPHIAYAHHRLPFRKQDYESLEKAYKQAVAQSRSFNYTVSDWLETETDLNWDAYCQQIESALQFSLEHRREINAIYASHLPSEIQLPAAYQTWRFNIRVPNKGHILDAIFAERLFASSHYASLAGIMSEGHCPHAEWLAASVINLFNDHHFTVEMAERTCDVILRIWNKNES